MRARGSERSSNLHGITQLVSPGEESKPVVQQSTYPPFAADTGRRPADSGQVSPIWPLGTPRVHHGKCMTAMLGLPPTTKPMVVVSVRRTVVDGHHPEGKRIPKGQPRAGAEVRDLVLLPTPALRGPGWAATERSLNLSCAPVLQTLSGGRGGDRVKKPLHGVSGRLK